MNHYYRTKSRTTAMTVTFAMFLTIIGFDAMLVADMMRLPKWQGSIVIAAIMAGLILATVWAMRRAVRDDKVYCSIAD